MLAHPQGGDRTNAIEYMFPSLSDNGLFHRWGFWWHHLTSLLLNRGSWKGRVTATREDFTSQNCLPPAVAYPCGHPLQTVWLWQKALSSEPTLWPSWTTLWILGSNGTAVSGSVRPAGGIMWCRNPLIWTGQPNFLKMYCLNLSFSITFNLYLWFTCV